MKQNIYDNATFFSAYMEKRNSRITVNDFVEQPALKSLLPDLNDRSVLELGCGAGGFCRYCVEQGAAHVLGVDISHKMLEVAREEIRDEQVAFVEAAIEDFAPEEARFDIIVSSLAFHYVADFNSLCRNLNTWLKDDGLLVFSTEHPIQTCAQGILPGWEKDESGRKMYWQVDCYSDEGERKSRWIVDGVIKYHRQISTILNSLLNTGFQIERILEPHASEGIEKEHPEFAEERRRPPFLIVRARKIGACGTLMSDKEFWTAVESLAKGEIIVDRPAGTAHPRYPDIIYPFDYGYLKDTRSGDGAGIDVWRSHPSRKDVTGIICTIDLSKKDMEMKILIGLDREECEELVAFHSRGMQKAILYLNPLNPQE